MARITPQETNIAKGTNYKLEITQLPGVTFWISQVNLPSININEVSIPHPIHGQTWIPSDTTDWDPVTLSFIVDEGYENYNQVFNWMQRMAGANENDRAQLSELMVDATLHVLTNNKNTSNVSFTFHDIFPTTLGELDFNNDSTEPLLCSLTMNYTHMTMEK